MGIGPAAVQEVEARFGLRVASIASLAHLVDWLGSQADMSAALADVRAYQDRYAARG